MNRNISKLRKEYYSMKHPGLFYRSDINGICELENHPLMRVCAALEVGWMIGFKAGKRAARKVRKSK